jgi:DNA adenine methylase
LYLDGELVNFFQVVKSQPKALIKSFEWELVSRSRFNKLVKADITKMNALQRAHRFYYIVMASWGGEFGNPRFQTSIMDKGHGNRLVSGIKYVEERIMPVYHRLQNVIIEKMDWRDCITRYDRKYSESKVVM